MKIKINTLANVDVMLVGESLVVADDTAVNVRELVDKSK